jgi:hypothetical protein
LFTKINNSMLMTFNNTARADTSARGSDDTAMGTIPTS